MKSYYKEIAKFEFLKVVRKKSFWLTTLFLPLLIGVIALISGLSSVDAAKSMEKPAAFSKVFIYDPEKVINAKLITSPYILVDNVSETQSIVKSDKTTAFIELSSNFYTDLTYNIYYRKDADFIGTASLSGVVNALIKQSAVINVGNPSLVNILNGTPVSVNYTYDKDGVLAKEGLEKYIVPIASLIIFFMAVYISSSFLLQSVSAEKENRMIETILSIVDKKSLMFGKMIGLMGAMLVQLLTWIVLGFGIYKLVMTKFSMPFPIDFSNVDLSVLPLNIFFVLAGFLFFAAIMTGVGAIGTGAEDSRNLSSIFILLSVFPLYLIQFLITNPNGPVAMVLSYFPFTSFMVLLVRNSFAGLPTTELIVGIVTSLVYVFVAMFLALKLFELGCLMYNRRPTLKEMLLYLKTR